MSDFAPEEKSLASGEKMRYSERHALRWEDLSTGEEAMTKGQAVAIMGILYSALGIAAVMPYALVLLIIVVIPSPGILNIAVFAAAVLISLLAQVLNVQQILLLTF